MPDTGIDGATIFIDDVYTLVWMGNTSVQQQPPPETEEFLIMLPPEDGPTYDVLFYDTTGAPVAGPPSGPVTGSYDAVHLPDGKIATIGGGDGGQANFTITGVGAFNADFTVIGDLGNNANPPRDAAHGIGRDDAGNFYGIGPGPVNTFLRLYKYNAAGPVANYITALPIASNDPAYVRGVVAVNAGGTKAYYTAFNGFNAATANQKVFAFNLSGNADLGVFIDKSAGTYHIPYDHCMPIITLPNGDLIVTWNRSSVPYGILERYNSSGVLQMSYTQPQANPTTYNLANHILADFSVDPDTFWAGQVDDDLVDDMRFVQYDVATGAVLNNFTVANGRFGLPFCIIRKFW